MPAQPFNINYANNKWQCSPTSQTIPKADGATFNVSCSAGKTGCRVCFTNSSVFGVSYLDLSCTNNQQQPFSGAAGDTSKFHIQDSGTTCTSSKKRLPEDDPYSITIGSSGEGKGKARKR
jgi:hypothetical protein